MRDADLTRMSKQAADFFAPYSREKAIAGVLKHLNDFWDPRMRSQLLRILSDNPETLDDTVRAAAELMRSKSE